jgi:plasmid stabilization system protein ParE
MSETNEIIEENIIEDVIEDAPEPEPEVVEEPEEKEPEPEKVPKGVQKRIDEITREKYEERRERQAAQERAERLERELEALRNPPKQAKQFNDGAPNPDDYDAGKYDPEYLEALTDYKVKQLFENREKQLKIAQQQSNVIKLQEQARKVHDDYDNAQQVLLNHPLSNVPAFTELVLDTENPAEIIYYLGKNPQEVDKIGEMSKEQAVRYMGRLEERITSLVQPKKAATNAPKPISPLAGAKGTTAHKDPNDMTMDEFVAWSKANTK